LARCLIAAYIRSFPKKDQSAPAAISRRSRIWHSRLSEKAKRFSMANEWKALMRCAAQN
jgi:hypothetical protein